MAQGKPLDGSKNPGGRPYKPLDQHMFESLCRIHCTASEMRAVCRRSDEAMDKWCREVYGEGYVETRDRLRGDGKASLRRQQLKLAAKSPAISIWLGKQLLGQRDPDKAQDKNDQDPSGLVDTLSAFLRFVSENPNIMQLLTSNPALLKQSIPEAAAHADAP